MKVGRAKWEPAAWQIILFHYFIPYIISALDLSASITNTVFHHLSRQSRIVKRHNLHNIIPRVRSTDCSLLFSYIFFDTVFVRTNQRRRQWDELHSVFTNDPEIVLGSSHLSSDTSLLIFSLLRSPPQSRVLQSAFVNFFKSNLPSFSSSLSSPYSSTMAPPSSSATPSSLSTPASPSSSPSSAPSSSSPSAARYGQDMEMDGHSVVDDVWIWSDRQCPRPDMMMDRSRSRLQNTRISLSHCLSFLLIYLFSLCVFPVRPSVCPSKLLVCRLVSFLPSFLNVDRPNFSPGKASPPSSPWKSSHRGILAIPLIEYLPASEQRLRDPELSFFSPMDASSILSTFCVSPSRTISFHFRICTAPHDFWQYIHSSKDSLFN